MTQQPFQFDPGSDETANFEVVEQGIIGRNAEIDMRMGLALFRALYEYADTGIPQGALGGDAFDGPYPLQALPALDAATKFTRKRGIQYLEFAADEVAPVDYRYLDPDLDHVFCRAVVRDATFVSGDVAAPEIKTWCEALGGTYTKAT